MQASDPHLLRTIAELRQANEELTKERDWTHEQHRRWTEERAALIEAIRELRNFSGLFGADLQAEVSREPAILLAMPFLTMGGAEAMLSQLCRGLRGMGFRIFLVTTVPAMESQGDTAAWFREHVAAIYHLPLLLEPRFWRLFLFLLIQQQSIRVLWQAGSSFVYELLPHLKQLLPEVAVVDVLFNPVGHTASYLKYRYLIDHVVTEHEGMRRWLMEHGESEGNISVVPNGVDLERYAPSPRCDWRTGKPRQEPDATFVIGFFGRLAREEAPDLFLEIAARLAHRPEFEFLLCGTGPMQADLDARAGALGLEGRLHFRGFVATREELRYCDTVIVCSRLDGRPNILMESLAAGVPVVASRVGGIPEMMPAEMGASLCDPGDVEAFCRSILALADDRALHRRLRAASRRHAEKNFSHVRCAQQYAQVFRQAASRPAAGRVSARLGSPPAPGGVWALLKMLLSPANLGRNAKTLWLLQRLRRDPKKARQLREYFDPAYYLAAYPDVAATGTPPFLHYLLFGFAENRNPSRAFHTGFYLEKHPDVARARTNPLLHYVMSGAVPDEPAGNP